MSLNTHKATLKTCSKATGIVVVIDVLRAFTTAAYAFNQGATEIALVSTIEEAFTIKQHNPDYLLLGEVNGLPIENFDIPNSPTAVASLNLQGKRLAMRTTAGTQGVVLSKSANTLYAASLCVATATARHISAEAYDNITFVETGVKDNGGGEEDSACADYISDILSGSLEDISLVQQRVTKSKAAQKFLDTTGFDFPYSDLIKALEIDQFDFAMKVERNDHLHVLKPVML